MEIKGDTIIFKSIPMYYDKESMGIKNNTVRSMQSKEEVLLLLNNLINIKKIQIHNTESSIYFERELTDISIMKIQSEHTTDDTIALMFVFTWK